MNYIERQNQLAESDAGKLALEMRPGTRWVTPKGDTVTVWMAWSPDTTGEALKTAAKYKWETPGSEHNTEIGVSSRKRGTQRVKVADVGDWKRADPFIEAPHPMVPRRAASASGWEESPRGDE